jgi:hypothetical protein
MNGSDTPLVHDGQPLVQPTRPQPELQQIGPRGARQSRTQPIFLTVFGMMQRICFAQHGRQQVVSHELLQLGTREPQLGAHVLQLGAPQAQPSLPP